MNYNEVRHHFTLLKCNDRVVKVYVFRSERIHKINAVRRSDAHRPSAVRWLIIRRCPSELRQAAGRRLSDPQTETGRRQTILRSTFSLKSSERRPISEGIVRSPDRVRTSPDDELTISVMG